MNTDPLFEHLDRLIGTQIPLTGNTGKVHVLIDLSQMIERTPGLRILDIGCVGPQPLVFWRPLFALYDGRFHLTGIDPDAAGIERLKQTAGTFSQHPIDLRAGTGYELERLFPGQQFDVIVFTQVLEHVFRYRDFWRQVHSVCKPGGDVLLTFDSGHHPRGRLVKESVKGLLARLGREHHYEHGWRDDEIEPVMAELGFDIVEKGFYCTAPLKTMHNHYLDDGQKNALMQMWFEHEYFLNRQVKFDEAAKRPFLILYYHVRRR